MICDESDQELLLRHLEGRVSPEETARVHALLRTNPAARAFLREVCEQAVMIADLARITAGQPAPAPTATLPAVPPTPSTPRRRSPLVATLAITLALASIALAVALPAWIHLRKRAHGALEVAKVTGSSQRFAANGRVDSSVDPGSRLGIGDTLETRSCGTWVELRLPDGSAITVAGHSTLRILEPVAGIPRIKLLEGRLWRSQGVSGDRARPISIETPTLAAEVPGTQFDIQTSSVETMMRVNEGNARVRPTQGGAPATISKGYQLVASLSRNDPLNVTAQPEPVDAWAADLWRVPQVILGRWLPTEPSERARLGAVPLLWPISERQSIMLHAVALAPWNTSDRPVVLNNKSRFRFRGRTETEHTVRFGFSTQKMRGAFAGKFELDIPAARLAPPGTPWQVDILVSDFRPLPDQPANSPDGLELSDVYALTVRDDAGLEINHIELLPPP